MCVLRMGISGSQSGCELLFPWVMWLSLGLHPTGKDEVVGGVSSKGFPGWPVLGFGLVPLQAGWFLAWPLCGALGMGGAAHPFAHPALCLGHLWWLPCKSHPAPAMGSLEAQGEVTNTCAPKARKLSPRGPGDEHPISGQVTSPPWSSGMSSWWQLPHQADRGK